MYLHFFTLENYLFIFAIAFAIMRVAEYCSYGGTIFTGDAIFTLTLRLPYIHVQTTIFSP